MQNIRFVIEYNGAGFHGWQKQPQLRTVQSELQRALEMVLRAKIHGLVAAGRTDAGVHARGQVVSFAVPQPVGGEEDLERLAYSVSSVLRGEVSVLSADFVPEDFNACRSALCKQYSYSILQRRSPAVLDSGRVWHLSCPLDIRKMSEEAARLCGEHDFASFRSADCTAKSSIRIIHQSEIEQIGCYVRYRVVANGFLKQMVRNIVGTLVALGRGKSPHGSILEILDARDRRAAAATAPPYGLCLDWVKYS